MKKSLRVLAFVVAMVLISTSLCGCRVMEEWKANHAIYADNDTILWNGAEYKRLPACDAFSPEPDYSLTLLVTDEDTPTLLSVIKGDVAYLCNDGMFLQCDEETIEEYLESDAEHYYGENAVFYCLAEEYDRIKDTIEQINVGAWEFDTYSYAFSSEYDASAEWNGERIHILTAKQIDMFITAVMTAVVAEGVDDEQLQFITDISSSTEDLLFFSGACFGVYRLMDPVGGISYVVWDHTAEEYYAIDSSYTTAFDDVFGAAIAFMEDIAEMYESVN